MKILSLKNGDQFRFQRADGVRVIGWYLYYISYAQMAQGEGKLKRKDVSLCKIPMPILGEETNRSYQRHSCGRSLSLQSMLQQTLARHLLLPHLPPPRLPRVISASREARGKDTSRRKDRREKKREIRMRTEPRMGKKQPSCTQPILHSHYLAALIRPSLFLERDPNKSSRCPLYAALYCPTLSRLACAETETDKQGSAFGVHVAVSVKVGNDGKSSLAQPCHQITS